MPSKTLVGTSETPPTLMSRSDSLGCGAGDERVGQHDRPGAGAGGRGRRGPGASPRRARPRGSGAGSPHGSRDGVGVEVGDAVDRDRRRARRRAGPGVPTVAGVGADEDAGGVDQPGAEAEPLRGVVVAAGDHDLRARGGQPGAASRRPAGPRRPGAAPGRRRRRRRPPGRPARARRPRAGGRRTPPGAPSMPSRWKDRPRCQSEVWRMRMPRTLGGGHRQCAGDPTPRAARAQCVHGVAARSRL